MDKKYKRMLRGLKKKRGGRKIHGEEWSLYILQCSDGSFYTGITNNLERRFKMHQAGRASRYTRSHGPVEMLYSEPCGDRSSALIRECEVKEWPKKKKVALVAGEKIPKRRKRRKISKE